MAWNCHRLVGSHKEQSWKTQVIPKVQPLTYLMPYIPTSQIPTKLHPAHPIPASLTTKTPRIPLNKAVIFVVLQPSLGDPKGERKKNPRGGGNGEEELGRIRPNQTLCADPSSPHIKDSRELSSARSAFHCSRLGIMRFGPGRSGCNYSFSTVVFPPDLETLRGQKTVVHVGGQDPCQRLNRIAVNAWCEDYIIHWYIG